MDTTNSTPEKNDVQTGRRRRWPMAAGDVRYFLPQKGSSPDKPELGEELKTEKDALVRAFQMGQPFFTVVTWDAVADMEGPDALIVKRAFKKG